MTDKHYNKMFSLNCWLIACRRRMGMTALWKIRRTWCTNVGVGTRTVLATRNSSSGDIRWRTSSPLYCCSPSQRYRFTSSYRQSAITDVIYARK